MTLDDRRRDARCDEGGDATATERVARVQRRVEAEDVMDRDLEAVDEGSPGDRREALGVPSRDAWKETNTGCSLERCSRGTK